MGAYHIHCLPDFPCFGKAKFGLKTTIKQIYNCNSIILKKMSHLVEKLGTMRKLKAKGSD